MLRRRLLGFVTAAGTVGLAGCTRVTCAVEENYDRLALQRVPTEEATGPGDNVIRYASLQSAAQSAVRRAVERGNIRQCHRFGDDRSDVEALYDHIERERQAVDADGSRRGAVYLYHDGGYYGLKLDLLDVVAVDSLPE